VCLFFSCISRVVVDLSVVMVTLTKTLQTTWLASVIIITVFLAVQMFFLHYRIDNMQKKHLELSYTTRNKTRHDPLLQIHAIIVNKKLTEFLNKKSTYDAKETEGFKNALSRKPVNVPYMFYQTRDGASSVNSTRIIFEKMCVLVLSESIGNKNFYENVANDKVDYVLLGRNVYYIKKDDELVHAIRNKLQEERDVDIYKNAYDDNYILFLFPMLNHRVMDDVSSSSQDNMRKDKEFNVVPFMGQFHKNMSSTFFVQIDALLESARRNDFVPMHVMAYKALM